MFEERILTIPNVLTLVRFACIGFLIAAFRRDQMMLALFYYGLAGLTDILDGYIARRFKMVTKVGKLMDPFADKAMLIAVLVCMFINKMILPSILILVIVKELMMVVGGILIYGKKDLVVSANVFGKISAALFFVAVVMTFFHNRLTPYDGMVMAVAVVMSIGAMVQYFIINVYRPYLQKKHSTPTMEQNQEH